MCGLVGIAGKLEFKDEAFFKRQLLFDYFRGMDSTGMGWLRSNGETGIAKIASHPIDFFDTKQFAKGLSGHNSTVFLGHNRAATVGKVTGVNAHPFEFGNIIGAHNGTLFDSCWKYLDEITEDPQGVDSASLFRAISEFGADSVIPDLQQGYGPQRGAWALTWFDGTKGKKGELYFLRNEHRPLWYAYNEDLTKIVWASEYWMLNSAAAQIKGDWKFWKDKDGNSFFPVQTDMLYTIDLEELSRTGKKAPPKWKCKSVASKKKMGKPVSNTYTPGHGGGSNTAPFTGGTTRTTSNGNSTTTMGTYPRSNVTIAFKELFGDDAHPFAGVIDQADFDELAKGGCSWCRADIHYGDLGLTVYERTDTILCSKCSGTNPKGIRFFADPLTCDTIEKRISRAVSEGKAA